MNATIRERRIRMATAAPTGTADGYDSPTHILQPAPASKPAFPTALDTWSTPTMNQTNSPAWVTFTYVSFGAAALMTAIGIWNLQAELWVKGYFAMAIIYLIGTCFTLAKTVRDEHEGKRLTNRIEEAKAEKILMGIDR
jgi:hypothetical protein